MKINSVEICKLAGIEPHIIEYKNQRQEVYPDLLKPENFIRMAETKFFGQDMTIFELLQKMAPNWQIKNRYEALDILKKILKEGDGVLFHCLKHALRRIQWDVI